MSMTQNIKKGLLFEIQRVTPLLQSDSCGHYVTLNRWESFYAEGTERLTR
jgi:hypothetical protein